MHWSCRRWSYYSGRCTNQGERSKRGSAATCKIGNVKISWWCTLFHLSYQVESHTLFLTQWSNAIFNFIYAIISNLMEHCAKQMVVVVSEESEWVSEKVFFAMVYKPELGFINLGHTNQKMRLTWFQHQFVSNSVVSFKNHSFIF